MTTWTNASISNPTIAGVDFLFSDGTDLLFSDGTDFVFREAIVGIAWANATKNSTSYTNLTKN